MAAYSFSSYCICAFNVHLHCYSMPSLSNMIHCFDSYEYDSLHSIPIGQTHHTILYSSFSWAFFFQSVLVILLNSICHSIWKYVFHLKQFKIEIKSIAKVLDSASFQTKKKRFQGKAKWNWVKNIHLKRLVDCHFCIRYIQSANLHLW